MLLDNYVSSYGVELPKDWTYYQIGHQHESSCVFCHEPHDYNRLFIYNPHNLKWRKETDAHTCDTCETAIINAFRYVYEEFFSTDVDDEIDLNVQASFRDDERAAVAIVERRIKLFNESYEFDNSVHIRYNHLNYHKDVYTKKGDISKCYFCEQEIQESNPTKIRVPVILGEIMNGGIAKACTYCTPRLDHDLLGVDLNSIRNIDSSKCSNCSKHYLIDSSESAYRIQNKSAHHLCPECAYEQNDRVVAKDNISFLESNLRDRRSPMERFKECRCNYCMSSFTIDLTLIYEVLMKHKIENNLVCTECRILHPKYLVNGCYVYKHNKHVWAVIYSTESKWSYLILKIHPVKLTVLELLKTTKEYVISNQREAVSLAADECYKIVEGKQMEIWEEA